MGDPVSRRRSHIIRKAGARLIAEKATMRVAPEEENMSDPGIVGKSPFAPLK